jgi:hypothetical protein
MTFTRRPDRQLQHVLEELGPHHLILPMRQPVGVQRDQRAGYDGEQRKAAPCAEQHHQPLPVYAADIGLAGGQGVDHPAEQDGLGEKRGRQRQIGDGQNPGEPCLPPEHAQHAQIKPDKSHSNPPLIEERRHRDETQAWAGRCSSGWRERASRPVMNLMRPGHL